MIAPEQPQPIVEEEFDYQGKRPDQVAGSSFAIGWCFILIVAGVTLVAVYNQLRSLPW